VGEGASDSVGGAVREGERVGAAEVVGESVLVGDRRGVEEVVPEGGPTEAVWAREKDGGGESVLGLEAVEVTEAKAEAVTVRVARELVLVGEGVGEVLGEGTRVELEEGEGTTEAVAAALSVAQGEEVPEKRGVVVLPALGLLAGVKVGLMEAVTDCVPAGLGEAEEVPVREVTLEELAS
jgi:hypothetical protein